MPTDIENQVQGLRRSYRQDNNLDAEYGVVASSSGVIYDTTIPGNVYVRVLTSNGLSAVRSVRGPNVSMTLYPGLNVVLLRDSRRQPYIAATDNQAQFAGGANPNITSQPPQPRMTQDQLETLSIVPMTPPSLIVGVKAWNPIVSGTYYEFPGTLIDFTGSLPATGSMYYAGVFIKTDYATGEVKFSTQRNIADLPLDASDVQETINARSSGAIPVGAIKLIGGQTSIALRDIQTDGKALQQLVNVADSGGGGVTSVTASAPIASSGGTTPNISLTGTVDEAHQASTYKLLCRVVAVANISTSSAPASIDGVTLTSGDRVLLTGQSTGNQNGIWVFNSAGSAMTRPTDFASASTVQCFAGLQVDVYAGTTYKGVRWYCTTTGAITIDTTTTTWQAMFVNVGTVDAAGILPLNNGGTNVDLSASGGATKILAQDASHVISARDLVAADIPNLDASKITSGLLALARGALNADLSATGPGILIQNSNGGNGAIIKPDQWCEGRLTLTTVTPVTTSDVTAATTIYFTPYKGNAIALYDGSNGWKLYNFSEVSIAVPSTLFKLFDVFVYDNSGTVTLETLDWNQTTGSITGATNATPIVITSTAHGLSNGDVVGIASVGGNTAPNTKIWTVANVAANTFELAGSTGNGAYTSGGTWYKIPDTRATALVLQDGVKVKSGATTRRYLGTAMTTGTSGQTEDSDGNRLLQNYYNRLKRRLKRIETADSWVYTYPGSNFVFRMWNNTPSNRVSFIQGVVEDVVYLDFVGLHSVSAGGTAGVGIGLDSVTTSSADLMAGSNSSSTILTVARATYDSVPSLGYHYLQLLEENGASNTTFYGDIGLATGFQYGATGYMWG